MSSIKDPLRIPGIREVWEGMRCSVWWPGVSSEVKQFVENCHKWQGKHSRNESFFYSSLYLNTLGKCLQ